MANRQHGRSRSPAGGRNPADSRTARTVPVSRSFAGGRNTAVRWDAGDVRTPSQPGTPAYVEPDVRRWPHPLEDASSTPAPEPALHYVRCALSYQNQLLADIKALLEQLAASSAPAAEASPAAVQSAQPESPDESRS